MDRELEVVLREIDPGSAGFIVLAEAFSERYEPGSIDDLFQQVIAQGGGGQLLLPGAQLEFQVRVWTGNGMRAALNLPSATVARMATVSAALNLDPKSAESAGPNVQDVEGEPAADIPELVVKLVGDSPVTGEEWILWRSESVWFEPGEIESRVREVLARGVQKVHGDPREWALQVSISLASDRGVWPAVVLPRDVISLMASCGCSFDFDPCV